MKALKQAEIQKNTPPAQDEANPNTGHLQQREVTNIRVPSGPRKTSEYVDPKDPILREVMPEVSWERREELYNKLLELSESLAMRSDLSMSLPQIGLRERIFLMKLSHSHVEVMVNPSIVKKSPYATAMIESCVSCPDTHMAVVRHQSIEAQWTNIDGLLVKMKLTGIASIVFQHEMDHMNGILLSYSE